MDNNSGAGFRWHAGPRLGHTRPGEGSGDKEYLDNNGRHTRERRAHHPLHHSHFLVKIGNLPAKPLIQLGNLAAELFIQRGNPATELFIQRGYIISQFRLHLGNIVLRIEVFSRPAFVPDAALPPRRPVPDAALPPASMQACIHAGEGNRRFPGLFLRGTSVDQRLVKL